MGKGEQEVCSSLKLVLYLGVSDTPAWIIFRANEYARNQGLAQFVSDA